MGGFMDITLNKGLIFSANFNYDNDLSALVERSLNDEEYEIKLKGFSISAGLKLALTKYCPPSAAVRHLLNAYSVLSFQVLEVITGRSTAPRISATSWEGLPIGVEFLQRTERKLTPYPDHMQVGHSG